MHNLNLLLPIKCSLSIDVSELSRNSFDTRPNNLDHEIVKQLKAQSLDKEIIDFGLQQFFSHGQHSST